NALRVTAEGSSILLEPTSNGRWAQVTVRDEGPGVPPSERELIFERFQRGSATGGRSGFGLGLAIGRELATRMDGTLELTSGEAPGAVFVLRLPAVIGAGIEEHARA